jgi:hypothetical protein
MSTYSYCMFMYLHRASWHSSATLTEGFPCFFLSSKANARVKSAKNLARPATFQNFCVVLYIVCFMSFCLLFVCKCVLYYFQRVSTQLQFNKYITSYHIIYHTSPLTKKTPARKVTILLLKLCNRDTNVLTL